MKHSYGITIGLHIREPDYTRGQSAWQWLLSAQRGAIRPWDQQELQRLGGHERRVHWVRVTAIGISLQINIEHDISNWSRP